MAEAWKHPAVAEFDWDRHNDLCYLDWFFSKWGWEPFPIEKPDVIQVPYAEPPVRKTSPLRSWPEPYLNQHFKSFEDGWK